MVRTDLFGFYGSLRRGMVNYNIFKSALKYIKTIRISGYELLTLGDYLYAVKSVHTSDSIVIEIFQIEDANVAQAIHQMEIEAGYVFERIEVENMELGIYLFEHLGNESKVDSGDWVEFFGTNDR
ncbi:MAG: gamma-glutamylcyclotransferase [Cyclobacteriaceae bacterium]|nr:gamma-glutamylcyclotransferase [Cyclobacteriaceae bacterium]